MLSLFRIPIFLLSFFSPDSKHAISDTKTAFIHKYAPGLDSSDYLKARAKVTIEFNKWLTRDEFEKTDLYEKRIKEQATSQFKKICYDVTNRLIDGMSDKFLLELMEYDADKEQFNVNLSFRDIKWQGKMNIPIDKAKAFRQAFDIRSCKVKYEEWGAYTNRLYPKRIIVIDKQGSSHQFSPTVVLSDFTMSINDILVKRSFTEKIDFSFRQYQPVNTIVNQQARVENKAENEKEEDEDRVFSVVQVPAQFIGGVPAWSRYLAQNLNRGVAVENGAPPGKYTVVVSFVIDKDGTVSEVQAENNPGYGTKAEAVRIIQNGPKWQPATQNGRNVLFRHKQAISFVVSED